MDRAVIARILVAAFAFASAQSQAGRYCIITGIDQNGFKRNCASEKLRATIGNAYATYGDAFKLNPSALPVDPSPLGVEIIASTPGIYRSGSDFQISFIRGFKDMGFGIMSDPGNSFYTERKVTTTSSSSGLQLDLGTLNIGGATSLLKGKAKDFIPILGAALNVDPETKGKGYTAGLNMSSKNVSVGLSYAQDPNDKTPSWAVSASLSLSSSVDFDFTHRLLGAKWITDDPDLKVTLMNLSIQRNSFQFLIGYKYSKDNFGFRNYQMMLSLYYQLADRARLAYLLNYRTGAQSLGLQVLLF